MTTDTEALPPLPENLKAEADAAFAKWWTGQLPIIYFAKTVQESHVFSEAYMQGFRAALAQRQRVPEGWRPMGTAPKDGTAVLLRIEGGEHPLQDEDPSVTIGSFGVEGGPEEDPTWNFAGWSWHQDCYCRGSGTPTGVDAVARRPHRRTPSAASEPAAQIECDAKRWRAFRELHWSESELCAVTHPKDNVKLGSDCPFGVRLEELVDKIIARGGK